MVLLVKQWKIKKNKINVRLINNAIKNDYKTIRL